ncbi:heavy-metal-associated domain-containing protein [Desulforamulus ruminis]|uniref:Copper ion-binding protein n=1 Tax=Desulforamulus ruminis (strain ATCC 23193 / DSM 2154 / NCIMB 8452 / DL) TaxID=696281 RepID=F6DT18_DESRL|nr:heavy-metal-associated domain-containing protein [Desulforamulus ruminis]AEG61123.1 copper ion-binding protein [Desulforamulus ruminis DSM 2154]
MSEQVIFRVWEMDTDTQKLEVINAMEKYSGVLEVEADMETQLVKVLFEPSNILAGDLMDSVEAAGYQVSIIQR